MTENRHDNLISFVIPTKNDKRLERGISSIKSFALINNLKYEIIICGENNIIPQDKKKIEFINIFPAQKGKCVREGVLHSKGSIIIVCDADVPISSTDLTNLLIETNNAEMITGNRYHDKNICIYKNKFRHIASRTFIGLVKIMFRINYDTQCGIKIFNSSAAKELFKNQIIKGLTYDVEIFLRAKFLNYRITQKDVTWSSSPNSTINLAQVIIPMFIELLYLANWNLLFKLKKISSLLLSTQYR